MSEVMKRSFSKYVHNYRMSSESVIWHLQQTTAVEGFVDPMEFLTKFTEQKSHIAGALFEIVSEERGEALTFTDLQNAWKAQVERNPFFASNLAMPPKPQPVMTPLKRKTLSPTRHR